MSRRPLDLAYFAEWLANGERGMSSETIVAAVTGRPVGRYRNTNHPYDPADLRRCMKLLDAYPRTRLMFKDAVRGISDTWSRMADRWDEMESLLREEMASRTDNTAPKTYELMRELRGLS
ncbi:hypothetical protein SEA_PHORBESPHLOWER_60 [Gordonia phage PhorbesPhlower]|nr:hypothetical protein SEA_PHORBESPHLOWER_60 [Gordonia phage PhorbesPhlower]